MFKWLTNLFCGCCICGRAENVIKIAGPGLYADYVYSYYHTKCIKEVLENPEKHNHRKVDKALHIMRLIREKEGVVSSYYAREEQLLAEMRRFADALSEG